MTESVETVENQHAEPIEVWFEPWGMSHTLPPAQSFRVVAVSEEHGRIAIAREGVRVTVFGWSGSIMRVYCGDQLIDDLSVRVPSLPPGVSMKSFIGRLFGGPGEPIVPSPAQQRTSAAATGFRRLLRFLGGRGR